MKLSDKRPRYDSRALHWHVPRIIKAYSAVRVRRPIRPGVDSVLGGLHQVEEHPASKDAEKCRTADRADDTLHHRIICI